MRRYDSRVNRDDQDDDARGEDHEVADAMAELQAAHAFVIGRPAGRAPPIPAFFYRRRFVRSRQVFCSGGCLSRLYTPWRLRQPPLQREC